jgi:hypothetical protein
VVRHIGGTSAAEEAKDSKDRFKGCIATHFFQSRHYYLAKHHGRLAAMLTDAIELAATPIVQGLRRLLGRDARPMWQRWHYPAWKMPAAPTPAPAPHETRPSGSVERGNA